MAETYDLIAINERGVYAICSDEAGSDYGEEFIRDALEAGNRVELTTTEAAVFRHRLYLAKLPAFAGLLTPTPSA